MALGKIGQAAYLKAGFLGLPKSGKTYTAMLLNIAAQKVLGKGPIAMYDTEMGSPYLTAMVKELTGQDLLGTPARSFDQLMQFTEDCAKEGVANAIIDSVTHPWSELCQSYLSQQNEARKRKGWKLLDRLEFQHWNYLKPKWNLFTAWYLSSPMHVTICGRAGDIYEQEVNPETGRKELNVVGQRMQTEKNTGYEPSLLVQMEREYADSGKKSLQCVATVVGDRFAVLTGDEFHFTASKNHKKNLDAVLKAFGPHINAFKGVKNPQSIDVTTQTVTGVDEEGSDEWAREKRRRTILCEEITGVFGSNVPGMKSEDKKLRLDLMEHYFGTRSWKKIEGMNSLDLGSGLEQLRAHFSEATKGEGDQVSGPPDPLVDDEEVPF